MKLLLCWLDMFAFDLLGLNEMYAVVEDGNEGLRHESPLFKCATMTMRATCQYWGSGCSCKLECSTVKQGIMLIALII